ncbi:hypothetical protein BpHYR1_043829 [Brachionus plicatilis]|uniref:Uncharacterized protein n=1 Tax=Brachionus plicatilis TaxID=10195 RepID=A0A3M7RWC1_BRAPC|nr:hypothetical protein BpHYR1_043829 [Brachionus plicatilis]
MSKVLNKIKLPANSNRLFELTALARLSKENRFFVALLTVQESSQGSFIECIEVGNENDSRKSIDSSGFSSSISYKL